VTERGATSYRKLSL